MIRIWTVWHKKFPGEGPGADFSNVPSEPERKALKEKALQFGARNWGDFQTKKLVEAKRCFPKPLRLGKDTSAKDRDLKALKIADSEEGGVFRRGRTRLQTVQGLGFSVAGALIVFKWKNKSLLFPYHWKRMQAKRP